MSLFVPILCSDKYAQATRNRKDHIGETNKSKIETELAEILKGGWTKKNIKSIQQLFARYQITDLPTAFNDLGNTAKYLTPKDVSDFIFASEKFPYELIGLIQFFESRVNGKGRTVALSGSEIRSAGGGVSIQKGLHLIEDLELIGYIKRKDKRIS